MAVSRSVILSILSGGRWGASTIEVYEGGEVRVRQSLRMVDIVDLGIWKRCVIYVIGRSDL
jgi:hypothetical protein